QSAFSETVAVDGHGNAVSLSSVDHGSSKDLQASFRPAGGSWQTPVTLTSTTSYFASAHVVFDAQGDAVASWTINDPAAWGAQLAVRLASSGTWRATTDLCQANQNCAFPDVAVDDAGNAVAVWEDGSGADYRIDASAGSIVSGTWQTPVPLSASGAA